MNEVSMLPVFDAALHHLSAWVAGGDPPPGQPRLEIHGDPPAIARDELGVALGGLRLPQVEVPLAVNSSDPAGEDLMAILSGSCVPLSPEQVRDLYGDRAGYLARFDEAAGCAVEAGVLLPRDADALRAEARGAAWPT